ncbi:hypothetical protein [Roseivirga misakiensis]|uniref:Macroglobulin domain-containing protein n=1 Tax=Roseivirga misakiensis TaxID=1563681 RepID=A0A1E5T2T2_9BACT|nr:hypothetical protein [Roseivirga misakiensis]OEK05690.1 hypothetical protein BFP71_06085 [Roseivirga misakiensis]
MGIIRRFEQNVSRQLHCAVAASALFIFLTTAIQAQVIEKAYISTDKDIYAPEDTIWFKGYVFDQFNSISDSSLAFHLILVNVDGIKISRSSWALNGGVTDGFLIAPENEGRFRIKAISGQMIGSRTDQSFEKDIYVRSDLADEIEVQAFPNFETYNYSGNNSIDIFTRYSANNAAPEVKLTYQLLSGEDQIKKGRLKTTQDGKVTLDLQNIKQEYTDLRLVIESEDKRLSKPVKLTLPIQKTQPKIDLQFFPEGGDLIKNTVSKVAFKAINENGIPIDFKGLIIDSNGKIVAAAESYYKGTGSFNLKPENGKEYFFKINSPFKIDSLYKLPSAKQSGVSLSITDEQKDGKQYAIVKASNDLVGKNGKLLITKNNQVISNSDFIFSGQENWEVAYENLGVGTFSFKVLNQNNDPLAERLFFSNVKQQLNVNLSTNKAEYEAREKVEAKIRVTDYNGNPVVGNFSFTVFDYTRNGNPLPDQPNLLAQILLTSELKGHIPTPNFYFSKDAKAIKALDLVMLTNGWRKHTPSSIVDIEGLYGKLIYKNIKRKPLKNRDVYFSSVKSGGIETFKTDEKGFFRISSTYLKNRGDSFLIFTGIRNKKDQPGLSLIDDVRLEKLKFFDDLLQARPTLTESLALHEKSNKIRPDKFQNTILLNSVTVEASRTKKEFVGSCPLESFHFEDPWTTKKIEDLDTKNKDILSLLKQVGYIKKFQNLYDWNHWRTPNKPTSGVLGLYTDVLVGELNNKRTVPFQIYLNCEPVNKIDLFFDYLNFDMDEGNFHAKYSIERIDTDFIESISINKTHIEPPIEYLTRQRLTEYFASIQWPIVQINTLYDEVVYKPIFTSKIDYTIFKNFTTDFYSPVYSTEKQKKDPVPDLRTTIHWQANVITNENGEANISYFNADRPNEIKITVEGVDGYSRLGFETKSYKVLEGSLTEGGDNDD